MGLVYDLVYLAIAILTSPFWLYRLLSTGKWRTDWAGRFGRVKIAPPDGRPTILIHAVSLGEVNLTRQLVKRLEAITNWRIVIASTTNTGFARATELYAAKHAVVRSPLDFSFAVRRFLRAVKPDMVALVELEVWPNFVRLSRKLGAPVCVINGRISERSYKRYRLIAPLLRPTFRQLHAAAQTKDYANRFVAMGVPADRVQVLDTMKWDTAQVVDPTTFPGAAQLAAAMGIDRTRPLIVAGSTAPGEDKLIIDGCPPHAQLLLAPRKPEWFDDVARLAPAPAPGMVRRTRHPDGATRPVDGQRFFLLDTVGELRKAYALADVAIVGRSFGKLYGSDMMEPIGLGKPTVIGPRYGDFADVMAAFLEADAIVVTDNPGQAAAELLADPQRSRELAERGRRVILSRQATQPTERHASLLKELMEARGKRQEAGGEGERQEA
jgi:3-deoxy-D-manno-octulosonic-acid transferase